jgi:DNA (cytosine-5)-methyltransferase 1
MKHGSLFSGIGGFDLAAEWMGWENVFHCEWMEFPRKVLDYHFPNADSHIDICKTDFKKYANKIDILTGGFPCQPFSLAGKRKGTDDERYLWGEMLRAIQEIKPKYVIAENVYGITNIDGGLVFNQVCVDLEGEGYEVQPFIIPACAKNAPHRRDRCWFIAQNPLFSGCIYRRNEQERTEIREFGNTCTGSADGIYLSKGISSNTIGIGYGGISQEERSNFSRSEWQLEKNIGQHGNKVWSKTKRCSTYIGGINWEKFPTQSPVCGGDDGISRKLDGITFSKWRQESIKGYGNAIVPQIAYSLFEIIQELNENN